MTIPSFDKYLKGLANLGGARDPTASTPESETIHAAAAGILALSRVDRASLAALVKDKPDWIPAFGYAVGLSLEQLRNLLASTLGTAGWTVIAREKPRELVAMLDENFNLVKLVEKQRTSKYGFGDVLVARAGRHVATAGAARGRRIEDAVEEVVKSLRLPYAMRCNFRGHAEGSCDLAIPGGGADALIVAAAKGFNSTGSKLTDAVREVEHMATARHAHQYVFAIIDGIGWRRRQNDLRRLYELWASKRIDGMYTLSTLAAFKADLRTAAARHKLLGKPAPRPTPKGGVPVSGAPTGMLAADPPAGKSPARRRRRS